MRTWILLADAGNARLLQSDKGLSEWTLVRELSHASERQTPSDEPGRVRQATTGARVAMEPRTPPQRKEVEKFARRLSEVLQEEVNRSAFDRLILVAPPAFLGILRDVLPPSVSERIEHVIDKDYLHLDRPKLQERLHEELHRR